MGKYTLLFMAAYILLAAALVCSAFIPRSAIHDNMLSSSELLAGKETSQAVIEDIPASIADNYADMILLNISYGFDAADPVRSVMLSKYYANEKTSAMESFREAVANDLPANEQYLRYWHGSALIVRIAHLFTNISGMYIISAVIIVILTVLLLFLLIRHRLYAGAIGTAAGLIAAGIWFVPLSLEYIWAFIIALAMSVLAVKLALSEKSETLAAAFMLCGIVTNYLDFLTCETLTLLMPLLLVIYFRRERAIRENVLFSVRSAVLWGIGYAGMWVAKWITAAIVLGEDVSPSIGEHIAMRIEGSQDVSLFEKLFTAVISNIHALFPAGYGGVGMIAAILLVIGAVYVCFVYRKKGANVRLVLLYAAVGIVPYIRYLVLHGHSIAHRFFTFRAQAATILAIGLIIYELIGGRRDVKRKRT